MFGRVPGTRPNLSESHSEISTRVPFCIARGREGTLWRCDDCGWEGERCAKGETQPRCPNKPAAASETVAEPDARGDDCVCM